jgi:hypothetical protein
MLTPSLYSTAKSMAIKQNIRKENLFTFRRNARHLQNKIKLLLFNGYSLSAGL